MTGLADVPFGALLDVVGSTDPAPGGGSSAAVATALAAALTEMAASIEIARKDADSAISGDSPAEARRLRELALELADRDISSYAPVLEALRLPSGDPARAKRLETALADASQVPLAIAEAAADTAALAARVATSSSKSVRGDAMAGVLIAESAAAAAAVLVEVNLATGDSADPVLALARAARRRAQDARDDALATLPRG